MRNDSESSTQPLGPAAVTKFWFPLALMWWMMSAEHTILAAFIGRMPDSEINLAAYGLAFSLALIVESPVIMLLTAGTALAVDADAYRRLFRFTTFLALVLTLIHVGLALSPAAYTFIIVRMIGAPAALAEPSRLAFLGMSAWTAAIAFRRLWQGVMIRFDRPRAASLTTVFRIAALALACFAAFSWGELPGAFAGGLALSAGVMAGVLAAGVFVWPTLRGPLAGDASPVGGSSPADTLSYHRLLQFYLPLALTSFVVLAAQPVLSVGLAWAPDAMTALAIWPVITAIVFMARSGGVAYQEVVVALIARPGGYAALRRFTALLAIALSGALIVLAWSPLGDFWLLEITDLSPRLAAAAIPPLRILAPAPAATVWVSWYRGRLVDARKTSAITRAVLVNLVILLGIVSLGIASGFAFPGANLAAVALSLSLLGEGVSLRRSLNRMSGNEKGELANHRYRSSLDMVDESTRLRLSVSLALAFATGLALIAGAAATETRDSACAGCHLPPESRFVARSLAASPSDLASAHAPAHASDAEGLRCIDCHSGPGAGGRLRAIGLGAMDLLSHVRGDYLVVGQEYLPYGGLAHPESLRDCRSCHEESVGAVGHENHFHNLLDDPEAAQVACSACHGAHRLGLDPPFFLDDASVAGACSDCHAVMGGPSSPFGLRLDDAEAPALSLLRSPSR